MTDEAQRGELPVTGATGPADAVPGGPPVAASPSPAEPARVRRPLFRRRRAIDPGAPGPGEEPVQPTGVITRPPERVGATGVIDVPPAAEEDVRGGGARLRRERRRLMAEREDRLFHLGGLAFELYRRGLLGEPVAQRRAGMIAEIDEAVRLIDDRLRALDEDRRLRREGSRAPAIVGEIAAGCCTVCRAEFFAGARFCMQCGTRFAPAAPAPVAGGGDTQVIPGPPA